MIEFGDPTAADVVAMLLLTGLVAVAMWTDVRTGLIPNRLTYPTMLVGLIGWAAWGLAINGLSGAGEEMGASAVGLVAGLVPFALLAACHMIGAGDAKLMGAAGALATGWQFMLMASFYAFAAALVMALIMVARSSLWRQTTMRLTLLATRTVKPDDEVLVSGNSPKLPFAVPAGIGCLLAGCEMLLRVQFPWSQFVKV